jgi:hypothetical protein
MKHLFHFVSARASTLTPYTVFFDRYLTSTLAVTISFLHTKYRLQRPFKCRERTRTTQTKLPEVRRKQLIARALVKISDYYEMHPHTHASTILLCVG